MPSNAILNINKAISPDSDVLNLDHDVKLIFVNVFLMSFHCFVSIVCKLNYRLLYIFSVGCYKFRSFSEIMHFVIDQDLRHTDECLASKFKSFMIVFVS